MHALINALANPVRSRRRRALRHPALRQFLVDSWAYLAIEYLTSEYRALRRRYLRRSFRPRLTEHYTWMWGRIACIYLMADAASHMHYGITNKKDKQTK